MWIGSGIQYNDNERLCVGLRLFWGQVGLEGELHCKDARHPVLAIRGAASVVGNDLDLGADTKALVISGPNAGGKTVVLKTAGLFALMVRHAIPIPVSLRE